MRYGSLFDATQTMVSKIADDLYEVQVVSWYDDRTATQARWLEQSNISQRNKFENFGKLRQITAQFLFH